MKRKRGNPQFTRDAKKNAKRRNKLIKVIFDCLPAASFRDLTDKVNLITPVTDAMINNTVAIIRRTAASNPDKYGWTIPHTKKGANPGR